MAYQVTAQVLDITSSTTIKPERKYGAWMAVNQGTNTASVMGYELQPGEGIDMLQAVPAGSYWNSNIQIRINPGALVRLTRLQYQPA